MFKKTFVATAVVTLILMLVAPVARADESQLHLLDDALWRGGCSATFTINPGARSNFGAEILAATQILSDATGISMVEVSNTFTDVDIRYRMDSLKEFGASTYGLFTGNGEVLLRDLSTLGYDKRPKVLNNLKLMLVLHETMHWLGLGHDESSQIMSAQIPISNFLGFGAGDLAGLAHISALNGCSPSL